MAKTVSERADVIPVLAEVFRAHGFEGASLALISEKTGLGKGSLYNFFPGGKQEMASAVLAQIDGWFENNIYRALRDKPDAAAAIRTMFQKTDDYFWSGRRVCLVGAFALDDIRDQFSASIDDYFRRWQDALESALLRVGHPGETAKDLAEEAVAGIQGGLVAARALHDPEIFRRMLKRLEARCLPSR